MKIALYVEDGLEQIVLTPQTDTETAILDKIHDDTREMSLARGSFYVCQGGWIRVSPAWQGTFDHRSNDDKSTMIVLRRKVVEPSSPEAPHDQD